MQSIRFNVDQDTLFFLINFANALTPETAAASGSSSAPGGIARPGGGAGELVAMAVPGGVGGFGGPAVRFSASSVASGGEEGTLEILPEEERPSREEEAETAEEVFEDAVGSGGAGSIGSAAEEEEFDGSGKPLCMSSYVVVVVVVVAVRESCLFLGGECLGNPEVFMLVHDLTIIPSSIVTFCGITYV